jgi:hypothetical protein
VKENGLLFCQLAPGYRTSGLSGSADPKCPCELSLALNSFDTFSTLERLSQFIRIAQGLEPTNAIDTSGSLCSRHRGGGKCASREYLPVNGVKGVLSRCMVFTLE